ncbi:DUF3325 domain-containing protein [Roseateles chitinivorans]|uniref:DUF3325 domain-containing protein n=1 Tax=Roseateles chitinivorans TaxID=2917965 RepID=UPI003D66B7C2
MMHVLSLLICVAAFAALAMATDRAQSDVLGRELPASQSKALRSAGWALLLASLALVVSVQGWGVGLVSYSGHTSFAAGVVFVALIVHQRRKDPRRRG